MSDDDVAIDMTGVEQMLLQLRRLKQESRLTYRELERRAAAVGDVLPRSTLATALRGPGLPRREVVAAYLRACLNPTDAERWLRGFDRHVAANGYGPRAARPSVATDVAVQASREAPVLSPGTRTAPLPRQLPTVARHFVGRRSELALLDKALLAEDCRVVVVSGMAGAGKTVLAVRWAHAAASAFPDGQVFVNLRGFGPQPALTVMAALVHLLTSLGIPADQVPSDEEQAAALFRSVTADLRLLVVLDDARDADQVRPLLPGGRHARVVVTSRDRLLGLVVRDGAGTVDVDVLPEADAVDLIGRIAGTEVLAAEPAAARDLARIVGYLPLAVRIAAADLPSGLADPVATRARQLTAGRRLSHLETRGDPGSALATAFHHSHGRLEPVAQRLFALIGLLPMTEFDRSVAAALLGVPVGAAEPIVLGLADAHLLTVVGCRVFVHDLVHEYAADLVIRTVPRAQREAALRRAYGHYLNRLLAAGRLLAPQLIQLENPGGEVFGDPGDAVAWLDQEYEHLRSAALLAADRGVPDMAWRLAAALRIRFMSHRDMDGWFVVTRSGLAALRAHRVRTGNVPRVRALLRTSLALAHLFLGEPAEAMANARWGVRSSRQAGWLRCETGAQSILAVQHSRIGHVRAAERQLMHVRNRQRAAGDRSGAGIALNNLGAVRILTGRLDLAEADLERALALQIANNARRGTASVLINLGHLELERGRLGSAGERLTGAIDLYQRLGDVEGQAAASGYLAVVRLFQGEATIARRMAVSGLRALRGLTDPHAQALLLCGLATVRRATGQHGLSMTYLHRALRLSLVATSAQPYAEALIGLAHGHLRRGELDLAGARATQALELTREAGYQGFEGMALGVRAAIAAAAGDRAGAARLALESADILRERGFALALAYSLIVRCEATGDNRDAEEIETLLAEAAQRFRSSAAW
ncbi:tetratricopeptide repeat protein [Micromonospora sp. NPDC049645]|uniref:ATP-binding protein n=1 Tax=Micromonospora sp. NPDC049645 TaxID=3155508 RepID=UPI003420B59A